MDDEIALWKIIAQTQIWVKKQNDFYPQIVFLSHKFGSRNARKSIKGSKAWSPNYGAGAGFGQRSHVIRPAKPPASTDILIHPFAMIQICIYMY